LVTRNVIVGSEGDEQLQQDIPQARQKLVQLRRREFDAVSVLAVRP